jgi:hypothetical protein
MDNVKIKMIPIESMLDILNSLFEAGYDYVDFKGRIDPEGNQDTIYLSIRPEYLSPEALEEDEVLPKNPSDVKLSEEDLDDLI